MPFDMAFTADEKAVVLLVFAASGTRGQVVDVASRIVNAPDKVLFPLERSLDSHTVFQPFRRRRAVCCIGCSLACQPLSEDDTKGIEFLQVEAVASFLELLVIRAGYAQFEEKFMLSLDSMNSIPVATRAILRRKADNRRNERSNHSSPPLFWG